MAGGKEGDSPRCCQPSQEEGGVWETPAIIAQGDTSGKAPLTSRQEGNDGDSYELRKAKETSSPSAEGAE